MFRRKVLALSEVLNKTLRQNGMETHILQKRLIDSWETVVGHTASLYTSDKFIRNQMLFVKITNPALRADLNMMRTQLVARLNKCVGVRLITDIRIY